MSEPTLFYPNRRTPLNWLRRKLHAVEYRPVEEFFVKADLRCTSKGHWVEFYWDGEEFGVTVPHGGEGHEDTDISSITYGHKDPT